jgi:hypothetical protein
MEAFPSPVTVVQLRIFTVLLQRAAFYAYAVWITSTMLAVGLG